MYKESDNTDTNKILNVLLLLLLDSLSYDGALTQSLICRTVLFCERGLEYYMLSCYHTIPKTKQN